MNEYNKVEIRNYPQHPHPKAARENLQNREKKNPGRPGGTEGRGKSSGFQDDTWSPQIPC